MKVLFDLNVILDILENRAAFVQDSAQALARVVSLAHGRPCVATHAVTTAFYLLDKQLGVKSARAALRKLLKIFSVLPAPENVLLAALDTTCPDYEDAVSFLAAAKAGCDYIVTRNVADFAASPVPALLPADFLERTTSETFISRT